MTLSTEEMLPFELGGLALRRIVRLSLLAWLDKTAAMSTEEVLFFGVVVNVVPLTCSLLESEYYSTSPLMSP